MDRDNALSEQEFCVAMKLVLLRRKGYSLPVSLPHTLMESIAEGELSFCDLFEPPTTVTDIHRQSQLWQEDSSSGDEQDGGRATCLPAMRASLAL